MALLMAAIAGQNSFLSSHANDANDSACPSPDTIGAQEGCTPALLDTVSGTVLGHDVLTGGCANGDLHVMRYFPGTASAPVVATWCG